MSYGGGARGSPDGARVYSHTPCSHSPLMRVRSLLNEIWADHLAHQSSQDLRTYPSSESSVSPSDFQQPHLFSLRHHHLFSSSPPIITYLSHPLSRKVLSVAYIILTRARFPSPAMLKKKRHAVVQCGSIYSVRKNDHYIPRRARYPSEF